MHLSSSTSSYFPYSSSILSFSSLPSSRLPQPSPHLSLASLPLPCLVISSFTFTPLNPTLFLTCFLLLLLLLLLIIIIIIIIIIIVLQLLFLLLLIFFATQPYIIIFLPMSSLKSPLLSARLHASFPFHHYLSSSSPSSPSSPFTHRAHWLVPGEDWEGGAGLERVPEVHVGALAEAVQVGGGEPGVDLNELVLEGEWASRAEPVWAKWLVVGKW